MTEYEKSILKENKDMSDDELTIMIRSAEYDILIAEGNRDREDRNVQYCTDFLGRLQKLQSLRKQS